MAARSQRGAFVEVGAGEGDDLLAAHRVIGTTALSAAVLGNHVKAVEGVIETAPARVGGIERVARIAHRDHQLRAGHGGDFGVDIGRGDIEVGRCFLEVADIAQELLVGRGVMRLALALLMPLVDLFLQRVAACQQLAIARREFGHGLFQRAPEMGRFDAGSRADFLIHQRLEWGGDAQSADLGVLGHRSLPGLEWYETTVF